jgi:hypothetical protein
VRIAVPDPYVEFDPNHTKYAMGAVPDTAGKEQALALKPATNDIVGAATTPGKACAPDDPVALTPFEVFRVNTVTK